MKTKKDRAVKQVKFRVRDEEWARLAAEAQRRRLRSVPALARLVAMEAVR